MGWTLGSSSLPSAGNKTQRSIGNYSTRLRSIGYDTPKQDKDSGLSGIGKTVLKGLDLLNRPLDAVQVASKYAGRGDSALTGLSRGFTGKETYRGAQQLADLGVSNKYAKGIGGFAIDMAADPLNLVTFGVGDVAKGVVKGGATLSERGLQAAGRLAREGALRDAGLALQKEHSVFDFAGLASKLGSEDAANAAIRTRAFNGMSESDFVRQTQELAQRRSDMSAGKGLSVAGKSIISGRQLQDLGGKLNTMIGKVPGVSTAGEAMARAFDPSFIKGLDASERMILKQLRSGNAGKNALKDIQDAEKFRNIATLMHGMTLDGKTSLDRELPDIISTGGRGLSKEDWNKVMTSTDSQRAAWRNIQESMGATTIKPDATLADIVEIGTKSFKGIGANEINSGVLKTMVDATAPSAVINKETGDINNFSRYFPHVVNREIDSQMRKGAMTRNFNVRNDFSQMRREEYDGKSITEINNLIRKKMEKMADEQGTKAPPKDYQFLETSFLNALMSRQLTSNKVLADKSTVEMVLKTFGQPVTGHAMVRDWLNKGYDIVVPNYSVNVFRIGKIPKAEGAKEAVGLMSISQGDKKVIGRLLEDNGNVLQKISALDAEQMALAGDVGMKMYALPKGVAEKFNRQTNIQLDDGAVTIGKLVDKFYSVWKPLVTGLRPQYHARNLASSGFNNFIDLGSKMFDPATQRGAAAVASAGGGIGRNISIDINGTRYTARQLHEMMVEHGALNTYFLTDTNSISKGISEDIARNNTGKLAARVAGKPAELGRATGNRVEEYSRAVNFIAHLKMGFTPDEAADITKKIHFDYQDLTDFEQSIKKVIPFYTWARKNIPLQLESILNNPTPYLAVSRAQQTGADITGTDLQDLPDYARRDFAIPLYNDKNGNVKTLDAGLPTSDLFYNMKDVAGGLNPLAKIPLEMYTNQNFLTQGSLNSYPEESAMKLGEGNSLLAKGLQNMPNVQAVLEAHPGAATFLSRALGSTGVINDINRYALPPQTEGGVLQGSRDANNTSGVGGFAQRMADPNMLKTFNPEKGAESRNYEYQRQLGNIVDMLKDKGYTVPTMQQLDKKRKFFY